MGYIGNSPAKNEAVDTAHLASPLSGDLTVAGTLGTTGDTAAGDDAAVGYTAAEGLILTGQGSTDDVTIKNDADATVLQVATGTTNVELTAGNLIIGTHGKGIDFSANTDDAGGMTSEILDDYEEGTWTPLITDGDDFATPAANNAGGYTKIGRQVTLLCQVITSSLDDVNGGIKISGVPFTIGTGNDNIASQVAGYGTDLNITAGYNIGAVVNLGNTTFNLYLWDAANGISLMDASEWSDDGMVRFVLTYFVD